MGKFQKVMMKDDGELWKGRQRGMLASCLKVFAS